MRVLFITGAGGGIGAETARLAVGRGHRVVIADIDAEAARSVAGSLGEAALGIELDVRDAAGWTRALDEAWARFGGVDVLVNNAAVVQSGRLHELPLDVHRQVLEVNVLGVIAGIQGAVPRFLERGGGHIVTVASAQSFVPVPGEVSYAATKHALRAITHGLVFELRDTPLDFTIVYVPAVETPMLESLIDDDANAIAFADPPVPASVVAEAILNAVEHRPVEVFIPRFRGRLLRALSTRPKIMRRLLLSAEKRGRKRLVELRRQRRAGQ
jgi:NAD(P)-dependent dehydrogenase (short-subunit alcohol dehydrogenase family)